MLDRFQCFSSKQCLVFKKRLKNILNIEMALVISLPRRYFLWWCSYLINQIKENNFFGFGCF
jgi:hypothetical protein